LFVDPENFAISFDRKVIMSNRQHLGSLQRFVRSWTVLALLLIPNLTATAFAQSTVLSQKATKAAELLAAADNNGTVRIIVQYQARQSPARDSMGTASENIGAITAENRAAQDAIASAHVGEPSQIARTRGYRGFSITPAFVLNATAAEIESLATDPRVTTIERDQVSKPVLLQSLPLIGMSVAYQYGATGAGQAVAVLDTGAESGHSFLAGKLIAEGCFSTTQGTLGSGGSVSVCPGGAASSTASGSGTNCNIAWDGCEHGTHVSGIATGLNSAQLSGQPTNGAAKSGKLISLQVFSEFTGATDCGAGAPSPCVASYSSDQISAMNYVYSIRNSLAGGVQVAAINMSLGGDTLFPGNCDAGNAAVKAAIDQLRSAGIASFIAAGNAGSRTGISSPGCISTAIAVAASKKDGDVIASYSNISPQVAIFAPGGDFTTVSGASFPTGPILSSVPAGFNAASFGFSCNYSGAVPATGGSYCHLAGTSMATPTAAGAFAAVRSACPGATITQIMNAFTSTGAPITDNRSSGTITKPRIRVDLAAQQACGISSVLAVTPGTDGAVTGLVGGPFNPASFSYQLSATGIANYSISGVPSWLSASSTSGTVASSPVNVTFSINPTANALAAGTYTATIAFNNSSSGLGNTTRTITLTISTPNLVITETTNIAASGNQGGPFSPASFSYNLSAVSSDTTYTISGVPSWLTASSTSGALTTTPTTVTFSINASANGLPVGTQSSTITVTTADSQSVTRTATLVINGAAGSGTTTLVSAVLPNARTTTVGAPVTAFATIINSGAVAATGCFIAPPASVAGSFFYQTTNAGNVPIGTPNTPVDIAAGQAQSFYFAVTPSQVGTQDIPLIFGCSNAAPPSSVAGLNTFLLTTAATPIPDMLSISDTLTHDGNIVVAGPSGLGIMVSATINIGAAGSVTFAPIDTPVGQSPRNLPVTLTLCPSDATATCTSPETASFTTTVAASQILTFNVYVRGQGTQVPYDPANNRIFLLAQQGLAPVGETSAALKMVAAPDRGAALPGRVGLLE
jgi:hypothetical protein